MSETKSASRSLSRKDLLAAISLVTPAVGSPTFVPILSHLCFDGASVTAYNDVVAISTRCEVDFAKSIPGDLLTKLLGSLASDDVSIQPDGDTEHVLIRSGRSKLTLPCLPAADYVFDFPDTEKAKFSVVATDELIKGLDLCLLSVGNDPTHAAQLGITLTSKTGHHLASYSTDNFTMSRHITEGDFPEFEPIILPTDFCRALVTLANKFGGEEITLHFYDGAVKATVGTYAQVFSKLVSTVVSHDFGPAFNKFLGKAPEWVEIPPEWAACFDRASIVLRGEKDRVAKVSVDQVEAVIEATSKLGRSTDRVQVEGAAARQQEFGVDPDLVVRATKVSWCVFFGKQALAFTSKDGAFTHLVSHCEAE